MIWDNKSLLFVLIFWFLAGFSVYFFVLTAIYGICTLFSGSKSIINPFLFLFGFSIALHLVFGAKSLRTKQEDFLKTIERFWEQSLLKVALDKKAKEIAGQATVDDKAVRAAYENMVKTGKTQKPFDQMYNQIKWEITKIKETQMMNKWLEGLYKKANIKIHYDKL